MTEGSLDNTLDVQCLAQENGSEHFQQSKSEMLISMNQKTFDVARRIIHSIPPELPFLRPYLEEKILLEPAAMQGLIHGVDLITGERLDTFNDRLRFFVSTELKALLRQGASLFDVLALTNGLPSSEAATKVVTSLGSDTAETMVVKAVGPAIETIAAKVPSEATQEGVRNMAQMFTTLAGNDTTRGMMTDWLSEQKWWQEIKNQAKTSQLKSESFLGHWQKINSLLQPTQ